MKINMYSSTQKEKEITADANYSSPPAVPEVYIE
jgi:hypothetical protein